MEKVMDSETKRIITSINKQIRNGNVVVYLGTLADLKAFVAKHEASHLGSHDDKVMVCVDPDSISVSPNGPAIQINTHLLR
jgi:hypothetical protein